MEDKEVELAVVVGLVDLHIVVVKVVLAPKVKPSRKSLRRDCWR